MNAAIVLTGGGAAESLISAKQARSQAAVDASQEQQWVQEGSKWRIDSLPDRGRQHAEASSSGSQLESRIADLAGMIVTLESTVADQAGTVPVLHPCISHFTHALVSKVTARSLVFCRQKLMPRFDQLVMGTKTSP